MLTVQMNLIWARYSLGEVSISSTKLFAESEHFYFIKNDHFRVMETCLS